MTITDRGVSQVISVILMVAIVVILTATASIFVLEDADEINEPAPSVAQTTGEFVAGGDSDEQIVRITHKGGDNVAVEEIEIIVRASGPTLDTEARLVDLPSDGLFTRSIDDEKSVQGNKDLIAEQFKTARIIVVEDSNVWSAGKTIEFRVAVSGADFRNSGDADKLEVIIVHTPSNAIIFEEIFTS